jgi:hypothetical protein
MKGLKLFCAWFLALGIVFSFGCSAQEDEWIVLFDGESLEGWKASENQDSVRVEDGAIVCDGPRSHLFYVGNGDASFRNFEFTAEVMTTPGSNSGIYFHTEYLDEGWPARGYEAQVLNSSPRREDGSWGERKLTGSLYAIRNVWKAPAVDNEWFQYHITVQGKTIQIRINGNLVVDYTESGNPPRPENMQGRLLSSGTFALQCHDPNSKVYYRNLRVKRLPDDLPTPGTPAQNSTLNERFLALSRTNLPLMDLHVHLKQGLTLEQALAKSRIYGVTYGIAVNCGLDMTVPDEAALKEFLQNYQQPPQTYLAMQAEGREWLELFSEESIGQFDYVFTDAMTWTNEDGKRMRLWVKDEVEIGNPQKFMDMLVDRIEGILSSEPIDIYVNPTYIPDEISEQYDELWTPERMDRVVKALAENQVALEINNARRIPSAEIIKRAKAAGVKFTCGTNNAGPDDLGNQEYFLEMIEECDLEPQDIWIP